MNQGESICDQKIDEARAITLDPSFEKLLIESFTKAARSFSHMLKREMVVHRCRIKLMTGEQFIGQLEDKMEDAYFASVLSVEKPVDTNIVFLLTEEEGRRLYGILYEEEPGAAPSKDLTDSIGELNNILGNTIISSLANEFGWELHGSVPKNSYDLLGAILEGLVLQDEFIDEDIICAQAQIMDTANVAFNVRLLVMLKKTQALDLWGR